MIAMTENRKFVTIFETFCLYKTPFSHFDKTIKKFYNP